MRSEASKPAGGVSGQPLTAATCDESIAQIWAGGGGLGPLGSSLGVKNPTQLVGAPIDETDANAQGVSWQPVPAGSPPGSWQPVPPSPALSPPSGAAGGTAGGTAGGWVTTVTLPLEVPLALPAQLDGMGHTSTVDESIAERQYPGVSFREHNDAPVLEQSTPRQCEVGGGEGRCDFGEIRWHGAK